MGTAKLLPLTPTILQISINSPNKSTIVHVQKGQKKTPHTLTNTLAFDTPIISFLVIKIHI